jgi:hypothetical protein
MQLNRISSIGVAATLAAALAATTSAFAAPAPAHQAATPHAKKAIAKGTLVLLARQSGKPGPGGVRPQLEESFTCTFNYGISSSKPVYDSNNQLTGYDVDFGITNECPLPMLMVASVNITDLTTRKNLGSAAQTQFAEQTELDSSAELPVNNLFDEYYMLASMLPPGFVWISASSPLCLGIGTLDLACSFVLPDSTEQSDT